MLTFTGTAGAFPLAFADIARDGTGGSGSSSSDSCSTIGALCASFLCRVLAAMGSGDGVGSGVC